MRKGFRRRGRPERDSGPSLATASGSPDRARDGRRGDAETRGEGVGLQTADLTLQANNVRRRTSKVQGNQ